MNQTCYVIVTAAYNEAPYIETTLRSVISQTVLPAAWIIASDGSTDQTDDIIKRFEALHPFITYVRIDHGPDDPSLRFGQVASRKVGAVNCALSRLSTVQYDYLCILDADISIDPPFFERLLKRCECDPTIGVSTGRIYNVFANKLAPHSGGGALLLFRNECFRAIGGLTPAGHEDTIAAIMVRMMGWHAERYSDLPIYHHKVQNIRWTRRFKAKYYLGAYDHLHGDILLWEFLRCIKETIDTPYLLGSCLRFCGYVTGIISGRQVLSSKVRRFVRDEQYRKIRTVLGHSLHSLVTFATSQASRTRHPRD